jgi:DNA-binding transcriptional LysR family regulator
MVAVDIRHLRYFSAVAAAGSYGAAAEGLHVAVPAVWKQVRLLEHELGVPLFERAGRRIRLTSAGMQLLERANLLLAEADRLEQVANDLRSGRSRQVVIACPPTLVDVFIGPVMQRFEREHPDARVRVRDYVRWTALPGEEGQKIVPPLDDLMRGSIDLLTGPRQPWGVDGFAILQVRLVAVVPPERNPGWQGSLPLKLLRGEALIVPPRGHVAREMLEQACSAEGFSLEVSDETADAPTALTLAQLGHGIAVLWEGLVPLPSRSAALPLMNEQGAVGAPAWLQWRKGAALPPAVQAFVETAQAMLDERGTGVPTIG